MSDDDAKTLAKLKQGAANRLAHDDDRKVFADTVALIERQAAEIARKDAEIERMRLMIPLSDEEAQKAYDEAPSVPISKERIAEMVRYATGRGDDGKIFDDLNAVAWLCEKQGHVRSATACRMAAAELDRLEGEVERLTLRWSSERPKVVGEYLTRHKQTGLRDENVFVDDDPAGIAWADDHEFAGPIAAPLEPATGEGGGL